MMDTPLQLFRRLTRVFVSPESVTGDQVKLGEAQTRHVLRVLRKSEGDLVAILDGAGRGWIATLENCSRTGAVARLLDAIPNPDQGMRRVEIVMPALKGERMELALQKCTEIGVCAFHIVPMERSVVRIGEDTDKKLSRYAAVVTAAAEQCGAFLVPSIKIWASSAEFLSHPGPTRRYIAWEEQAAGLPPGLTSANEDCLLASGPEGGLPEAEVERWKAAKFTPVGLGRRVLRAETAPIVLAALALCANSAP